MANEAGTSYYRRETYGTPYSPGELRGAAANVCDVYYRELMEWAATEIERLHALCEDFDARRQRLRAEPPDIGADVPGGGAV